MNKSKKSKPAKTKMWVDDGESVHHKKVNKSDAEKLSKLVKAKDVTGTMAQIDSEEAATTATTPAKATPAKAAVPAQPASPNKKSGGFTRPDPAVAPKASVAPAPVKVHEAPIATEVSVASDKFKKPIPAGEQGEGERGTGKEEKATPVKHVTNAEVPRVVTPSEAKVTKTDEVTVEKKSESKESKTTKTEEVVKAAPKKVLSA